MSWKEEYCKKCVTAEEAVKQIKSGDRVIFAHAAGEATTITDALVANKEQYENVEIVHYIPMGKQSIVFLKMQNILDIIHFVQVVKQEKQLMV